MKLFTIKKKKKMFKGQQNAQDTYDTFYKNHV